MKRLILLPFLVIACLSLAQQETLAGEMYKWVDADGVVHFQDFPPPSEPGGAQIETISERGSLSVANPVETNIRFVPVDEPETVEPRRSAKVEIYVTNWCRYCRKAISFLNAQGIPYTAYDVDKDKTAARRQLALSGRKTIPFAVINGEHIYGFHEARYRRALNIQ